MNASSRIFARPRRWTRPLRFHLSVIVVALVVAIAAVLIVFNFQQGRRAALASAAREMRIFSDRIVDRYRAIFGSAALMVEVASSSAIERRPNPEDLANLGRFLQQILHSSQYVDSAYVGYPTGVFVDSVSISNDDQWRTVLSAPAKAAIATRLITIDDDGRRLSRWEFLDSGGHWLATTDAQPANYDPRARPWYQAAVKTNELITTSPYHFATTKALGITLARHHSSYGTVVVGADILLGTIDAFLSTQLISPNSRVFIFDAANRLIARSDQSTVGENECIGTCKGQGSAGDVLSDRASAVSADQVEDRELSTLASDGREYLVVVSPISSTPVMEGGRVVSLAPVEDLTKANELLLREGLLISAGVLALGIACAFLMARQISRSLVAITVQTERLMRFELGPSERISSRISEILQLDSAMNAAREAIATFALYVPADLVRRIIRSGEFTARAGQKQNVTALFSDIFDFTRICEQNSAEIVVSMLSDYFDLFSETVRCHGGVIIQFSGDSVFAVWNAPEADDSHIDHACQCALELAERIYDFNRRQASRGAPELITRFGLHTGAVMVGSVGAKDRLKYTAMGDAINLASRLEGMNKTFNTTILVSAAVVAGTRSAFCFRPLGSVRVKGRDEEVDVFELRAAASADAQLRET